MKYPSHKGGNFMSPLHSQPHADKKTALTAGEGWQILVRDRTGISRPSRAVQVVGLSVCLFPCCVEHLRHQVAFPWP